MSLAKSENKTLLANASFLALMQAANSFLPLLTVPFLVRTLGVELFGQLAFVTAVMYYFVVLADYGFNLTATRNISLNRQDYKKINDIYSHVMLIKIMLLIIGFLCLVPIVLLIPSFFDLWPLYLFSYLVVIFQSLFPMWFFQGMEEMKYITYLSVSTKILFAVGVFVLISGPSDYLWVPLLNAAGFFLSVFFSIFIIHFKYNVSFESPSVRKIREYLIEGWYVFLSQVKITLFSSTNIVILGFMAGPVAVGYYVGAEKLMRVLALVQTPITGSLFPLIANKMAKNKGEAIRKLKNIAYLGSVLYLVVIGVGYLLSDHIIYILYGDELKESSWVLKVMLIIPLLIFLNNIFGTQILLNTGREKKFFYVLLFAAILSLLLCTSLTYFFSYKGTTVALLLTEVFVVLVFFGLVYKDWFFLHLNVEHGRSND